MLGSGLLRKARPLRCSVLVFASRVAAGQMQKGPRGFSSRVFADFVFRLLCLLEIPSKIAV